MGLGFPKRLVRSGLGPKLRNNYPVENPESDVGDTQLNALFWNVAGMGLVQPRAVYVGSWNGSQMVTTHQAEAWNPENDQPHPAIARASTGRYSYTFASTYLDEDGVAVATDIRAARVNAMRVLTTPLTEKRDAYAWIDPTFPLVVQVAVCGTTLEDHPFWLEVL